MKRIGLHVVFWTLYILQDALLVYTWVGPSLGPMAEAQLLWVSLAAATVMAAPKWILTYFVLYISIKKLMNETQTLSRIITEIIIVLLLSIAVARLLSFYVVYPYIYGSVLKNPPLLEVRHLLMALMDIGAVTGLAAFVKFVRVQLAGKEREKNIIREKLETELKFLRNQTNPHFLMNTLNNIYALARKKSDDTPEVVMKLSELLRFILYESGEKQIRLADEVKVVEDYLELERMRYNNRLSVSFEKELDREYYSITPLLLLPFVENAFKHGVSETRFESYVNIQLQVQQDELNFIIENSKESKEPQKRTNPIGLNNVRRQLELMYRHHRLEITDDPHRFRIHLFIKLNSYAEI